MELGVHGKKISYIEKAGAYQRRKQIEILWEYHLNPRGPIRPVEGGEHCCQVPEPLGYHRKPIESLLLIHVQNIPHASLLHWGGQAEFFCDKVTEVIKTKQQRGFSLSLHFFPGVLSTEMIIILVLLFLMLMSTGAKTEFIYSPPGAGSADFFCFFSITQEVKLLITAGFSS